VTISLPSAETAPIPAAGRRRTSLRSREWLRHTNTARLDRVATDAAEARTQRQQWERSYRRRVLAVDMFVIAAVVTFAQVAYVHVLPTNNAAERISWQEVTLLSVVLAVAWFGALGFQKSQDISLTGNGTEEYRRVLSATAGVFGLITIAVLLLERQMPRGYLGIALGAGSIGLTAGRFFVRRDLIRRRMRGKLITRVVLLGKPESVRVLCESLGRSPSAGYRVVGACVPDFDGPPGEELLMPTGPVPVLGDDSAVESALSLVSADVLAVAAAEHLGYQGVCNPWRRT
jgi:FlaA1/EpsC-like NDP-sugar epimerase